MLCEWHILKAVLTYIKYERVFQTVEGQLVDEGNGQNKFMARFSGFIGSATMHTYETCWKAIQQDFGQYPDLLKYLTKTWINPWATRFIQAYADQHLHFGNRVTSRIEGGHSILKTYLQSSMGDLKMVIEKVNLLLTNQHIQHEARMGQARDRTPQRLMTPLFVKLIG